MNSLIKWIKTIEGAAHFVMTRFQPDLIHQLNSEVHIWQHDPASIITPIQIERCEAVLSAEERERLGQFYHQRDQHTFLVSHAMLRCTLSAYIDKDPAEWLYEKNKYGRPEIMPEQNTCGLRFNLTHTQGYVACIVSKLTDWGVDAEWIDRNTDVEAIAQSVFSTSEQLDIQNIKNLLRTGGGNTTTGDAPEVIVACFSEQPEGGRIDIDNMINNRHGHCSQAIPASLSVYFALRPRFITK